MKLGDPRVSSQHSSEERNISLFRELICSHLVHSCSNFLFRCDWKDNIFCDRSVHCLSTEILNLCCAHSVAFQQLFILVTSSVRIHVSSLRVMFPVFCNSVSGNSGLILQFQSWKLLAKDLNDLKHCFYACLWMSGYDASHRDWNVGMFRVFENMSWLGIEKVGGSYGNW